MGAQRLPELFRLNSAAVLPEEGFSGVVGAAFMPNGTIVVADGGRKGIHRFDTNGKYIGTIGREGKGPGEFEELFSMSRCSDGSLLTFDPAASRINVYGANGSYSNAIVPPRATWSGTILSCDGAANAVVLHERPRTRIAQRGVVLRFSAAVVQENLRERKIDTLTTLSGTDYYIAKGIPTFVEMPLAAKVITASSGDLVAVGVTTEPQLLLFRQGRLTPDTLKVNLTGKSAPQGDWQKAVEARLDREYDNNLRDRLRLALSEIKPQANSQLYDGLMVHGGTGTVYIRAVSRGQNATWTALNSGKQQFTLPSDVDVLDVSGNRILGLQRLDDGAEEIIVYSLVASRR